MVRALFISAVLFALCASPASAKQHPCQRLDLEDNLVTAMWDYALDRTFATPGSTDTEIDASRSRCVVRGGQATYAFRLVVRDADNRNVVWLVERGYIEPHRRWYDVTVTRTYVNPRLGA